MMKVNLKTGEALTDDECEFSGLPENTCSHCIGDDDLGNVNEDDYERISKIFPAMFPGQCTIDPDHRIKRGDKVSRVQHADNPMLTVSGVACASCTILLPRAKS